MGEDILIWFWSWGHRVLAAPYLLPLPPLWAWLVGTFCLSLWCAFLGELTLAVVFRVNRRHIREVGQEVIDRQRQSINALKAGDKESYNKINKLASEAFGRAFFLQIAMGMASLWPVFFAAAWLQAHFGHVRFHLPLLPWDFNFLVGLVPLYILARVVVSRLKRRLPFFRQTLALARGLDPDERGRLLGPPPEGG
ncbi:MAG: hypothetical protein AB1814_04795 [Thermodesulfobacteriota bacterium]